MHLRTCTGHLGRVNSSAGFRGSVSMPRATRVATRSVAQPAWSQSEVHGQIARDGVAASRCGLSVLEPESCLPPESSLEIEYRMDFVQTKKLLSRKLCFGPVSLVGTSELKKSWGIHSGIVFDHQHWKILSRNRARSEIFDSRHRPAAKWRNSWTEGLATHQEVPLTPLRPLYVFVFTFC